MVVKTFHVVLDGPANAVTTNKDAKQVAVVGRNVFKIFGIDLENLNFVELANLRVGNNQNLNFSCNDVAWNPIDENILATGATNGAVVIWDLQKNSRSKMDCVFQDHKRTVNTICFHPLDQHLLVSCSQDGTIKLFDIRGQKVERSFKSGADAVRDLQFSPHPTQQYFISSVQENGNVQIWDFRQMERAVNTFTAHNGPVFSCDWHPTERRWLATAGRDRSIRIWDMESGPPTSINKLISTKSGRSHLDAEYIIQTIAPVARVRWRPKHKWNIASGSLVMDFSVSEWDIRRPYIPSATFTEPKYVTKGFVWIDSNTLLSAGKDNTLYHHFHEEARKPCEQANPIALDISNNGRVSVAIGDHGTQSNSSSSFSHHHAAISSSVTFPDRATPIQRHSHHQRSTSFTGGEQQHSTSLTNNPTWPSTPHHHASSVSSSNTPISNPTTNQSFQGYIASAGKLLQSVIKQSSMAKSHPATSNKATEIKEYTSSLYFFPEVKSLSQDWFVDIAKNYQLTGRSIDEICSHNADVTYRLSRPTLSQTWKIIQTIHGESNNTSLLSSAIISSPTAQQTTLSDLYPPVQHSSATDHSPDLKIAQQVSATSETSHLSLADFGPKRPFADEISNPFFTDTIDDDESLEVIPDHKSSRNKTVSECDVNLTHTSHSYGSNVVIESLKELKNRQPAPSFNCVISFFDISPSVLCLTSPSSSLSLDESYSDLKEEAFFSPENGLNSDTVDGLMHSEPMDELSDTLDELKLSRDLEMINEYLVQPSLMSESKVHELISQDDKVTEKLLLYHSAQGDVQTCVSILLTLGDKVSTLDIDPLKQEKWFTAYIELLQRFQLWTVATLVTRSSQLPNIQNMNQESTNISLCCGNCGKLNHGGGPFVCKNCSIETCICCVCQETVFGLYAWCEGCSHGGHLLHLMNWFEERPDCPSGCGHLCEYK